MEQVIITSKTQMKDAVCVGGLTTNGEFIRLLDKDGKNQRLDTEFEIRQVWDIEFTKRTQTIPPHIEDVLIISKHNKKVLEDNITMLLVLKRFNIKIWRGNPENLFDGKLKWTENGSAYINHEDEIPKNSVGFWISDRDLTKKIFYNKVRYDYPDSIYWRNLPYVGLAESIDVIPAGTLLRVSLARWWNRNGETEDRCSLQLSGSYDINEDEIPF